MKAIARNNDPGSSHAAAAEITNNGTRHSQNIKATIMVNKYPGLTSLELSRKGDLDRYQLARRLSDCEGRSVKKGEIRQCSIGNRPACTWNPMPDK